jgi:transposase
MIALPSTVRVYAAPAPVDLRKGFDALARVVRETLALDPLSGHLFLFFNRRANRAKVLFFTATGYYLVYKRLEQGRFQVPRMTSEGRRLEMDAAELALVLEGMDLRTVRRVPVWRPSEIGR